MEALVKHPEGLVERRRGGIESLRMGEEKGVLHQQDGKCRHKIDGQVVCT